MSASLLSSSRAAASGSAFKSGSSRRARVAVVCQAQQQQQEGVVLCRRAAIATLPLFAVAFALPQRASALIPDEEDEDMLERAKANRKKRLVEQRGTTREFIREEGLKNQLLDSELVPVQRAVNTLAKSGVLLYWSRSAGRAIELPAR